VKQRNQISCCPSCHLSSPQLLPALEKSDEKSDRYLDQAMLRFASLARTTREGQGREGQRKPDEIKKPRNQQTNNPYLGRLCEKVGPETRSQAAWFNIQAPTPYVQEK
jgi:hypothetical protein